MTQQMETNEDRHLDDQLDWTSKAAGFLAPVVLAIAISFVIAIAALSLVTPVWPLLTTPSGRDIPDTPPAEENRVYHPFGFSIVAPPNWNAHVGGAETGAISMYPGGAIPRRYSASLSVSLLESRPEYIREYAPVTFQGQPAFEDTSSQSDGGFENPGHFSYRVVLHRDGDWYAIRFHVFKDVGKVPAEIAPYLASFRTHQRPKPLGSADNE